MSSSGVSAGADGTERAAPKPRVVPVICGPTASGKSEVAMQLAQRHPLFIISADSRQIYRGFDVGTAKPSPQERLRVPHRGVDVVEPTERFSAAAWSALAQRAIGEAHAADRIPVIVGGTGFYIAAMFRPLWTEPPLDPARRATMQRALAELDTPELQRWCGTLDPARAHLGRAQLLRAIEVALLTGQRLSEMHVARARAPAYLPSYLLVDPGPELATRIARRVESMLTAGWADEVRQLMQTVPADAPAWHATGYEAVRDHLAGTIDRSAMVERIIIETRQYAKRQRTWFRNQLERDYVQRLVPTDADWPAVADRWLAGIGDGRRTIDARSPA
jgi:tRNA dimethylallyltransferase